MHVEARRGDEEAVERIWRRLSPQGRPEVHLHADAAVASDGRMWLRLGRFQRAVEVLAPLATGQLPTGPGVVHDDELIMPYLHVGRVDEAVAAHQRCYSRTGMKLQDVAAHLEFCARTGSLERGLDVLHRNLHYVEPGIDQVEPMWTAAAAALLCLRVMEQDLDREWIWPCDCDDPATCTNGVVWSYAELASQLRWDVMTFAEKLDELDDAEFQSTKMRDMLLAEPIAGGLVLPPDTAEPRHRAAWPVAAHLPVATVEGLRDGLREARALERVGARDSRMQLLLQNAVAGGRAEVATEIRLASVADLVARPRSRPHRLFALLAEVVRHYAARPSTLDADQADLMWSAVPVAVDRVLTHPAVHLAQIRGMLRRLEPHCRPGRTDLHHLRWFTVEAAVRRGDADAAVAACAAFDDLPPDPAYATQANILRRTRWWLDLHRDSDAIAALTAVAGDGADREDYLLMAYLRTGRLDEAHAVHERTHRTATDAPEVAVHLQFCASTGRLERGDELIQRHLPLFAADLNDATGSIDRVRVYAAAARMSARIVSAGRDRTWTWPAAEAYPAEDDWSYERMAEAYSWAAASLATRWDELTGTTATRALVESAVSDPAAAERPPAGPLE
jgi:hypothetical protein